MKANQAFKANDEAVSPVIGVILMVAITVVLAAVVFVLVSNLSKNSNQSAPNISFNQDKAAKTLTIISADAANWKDIKISIADTPATNTCTVKITDAAGSAVTVGTPAAGSYSGTPAASTMSAGDSLAITGTAADSCQVQLTYVPANQLLGTWTYVL